MYCSSSSKSAYTSIKPSDARIFDWISGPRETIRSGRVMIVGTKRITAWARAIVLQCHHFIPSFRRWIVAVLFTELEIKFRRSISLDKVKTLREQFPCDSNLHSKCPETFGKDPTRDHPVLVRLLQATDEFVNDTRLLIAIELKLSKLSQKKGGFSSPWMTSPVTAIVVPIYLFNPSTRKAVSTTSPAGPDSA